MKRSEHASTAERSKIRQLLKFCLMDTSASTGCSEKSTDELTNALLVGENTAGCPDQWYMKNPARYQAERDGMLCHKSNYNPREVQLKDGRRGFLIDLLLPEPEGDITDENGTHCRQYTVLIAWDKDHPGSGYGSSVKFYFVKPTMQELAEEYKQHGRLRIPHTYQAVNPITGEPDQIPDASQVSYDDARRFSIVAAINMIIRWLSAYIVSKYRDTAYEQFCQH